MINAAIFTRCGTDAVSATFPATYTTVSDWTPSRNRIRNRPATRDRTPDADTLYAEEPRTVPLSVTDVTDATGVLDSSTCSRPPSKVSVTGRCTTAPT